MKCSSCGHWNSVQINKIFNEENTIESKVKAYIPMYERARKKRLYFFLDAGKTEGR